MRPALIAFLATFGSTSAAHAQDANIQTFLSVCMEGRASFAASEAAASGAGWFAVSEDSRPELGRIFEFARSAIPPDTPISQLQAYGNERSDAALVLTELTVQGLPVNGCYVYDFAATEPFAPEVFLQIVGTQPTEAQNIPGEIVMQKWLRPSAFDGVATLRVAFVAPGGEASSQTGLVGLALASTSVTQSRLQ